VAVRDAPKVAEQCWHFRRRKPERTLTRAAFYWGIWKFSPNGGGESLRLSVAKSSVEQLVAGSHGYDIPAFGTLRQFKTWPRKARRRAALELRPRGRSSRSVSLAHPGAHRQPDLFAGDDGQDRPMYPGKTIDQAIDWAASELEGFMRT
jgi:hypothetical protein